MDSSAGEEETCLRRDSWCPVVPVCHCYTQPSIYVHNKAPTATYLMRNTSIWCRGSRPIYKSRNSALQQRTKIRNNTQTCRVDPGSVSALQRSLLFKFCVRRVRCVCRGLTRCVVARWEWVPYSPALQQNGVGMYLQSPQ